MLNYHIPYLNVFDWFACLILFIHNIYIYNIYIFIYISLSLSHIILRNFLIINPNHMTYVGISINFGIVQLPFF